MVEHYRDHWARQMIAHHSHLKCGQTKVTNLKEPQCVLLGGLLHPFVRIRVIYNRNPIIHN